MGHTTKIPGYIPVSQRPVGAHVFRELDPLTSELFGALITFRKNEAFKNGVPAYSYVRRRNGGEAGRGERGGRGGRGGGGEEGEEEEGEERRGQTGAVGQQERR